MPFSSSTSSAASPSLASRVDAALEALRTELLSLGLPGPIGESCPATYERELSAALNRTGCSLLGAVIEELDERSEGLLVDGARYYRAGASAGDVMSSFGRVRFERSLYRRRGCGSVFPADIRFGVIGGFWSPLAARQASLSLSLAPAKDCEGLFRELGGMAPSATALNQLAITLGSAWDVVQADALTSIRSAEGVPLEAVSMAVSIDGAMLGMRKEKDAPGRKDTPRPAGFREASSGTISLCDANGKRLRSACYGRMPEAGKVSLKEDVLREAGHWMEIQPELEVVFIADGSADNWRYCEEAFPHATQVLDVWHNAEFPTMPNSVRN